MKKKNLTIVLALLAALALVFAAGCDDGSNSSNSSGNGETPYTSLVSDKSFTYTNTTSTHDSYRTNQADETYLNSVVLSFSETTNAVEVKVEYLVCDYDSERSSGGSHGVYYLDTTYSAAITTATYTYTEDESDGDTVAVTLPANDDNQNAVTLTFAVTKADSAVTALAIDDDDSSASYTVKGNDGTNDDETGIDLFDTSVKGALANETEFGVQS